MSEICTYAETRAQNAQNLAPFQDLNLLGIKSKVAQALDLIGRGRIFSEYTLHDVRHVNKMLESFDWIIPPDTKSAMSTADWLLTVLSVYLHDLGMLVTDKEYEAREDSGFDRFCESDLFGGEDGVDYQSKVERLGEDAERFMYQEYVRQHHASRIGDWIRGKLDPQRGVAPETVAAVSEILAPLPAPFRADLALVCESHHLNDLYDTDKYPVAQPYANSDSCTANVQYAAVLLRTADLLHITDDRTPSVMFRLVNPQDPISQREWAKQQAVRRVKDQKGRDADGNFSEAAARSVVEVFATFEDADAFFGLTSYLVYVQTQLRQSVDWIEGSAQKFDLPHRFLWREVDTSHVRAQGFSPRQLSFSLDQGKILDLLTGHTIYNDTSVVLRELVQNAIDAVRLQLHIDKAPPSDGLVEITWNPDERILSVRDNGTGMSKAVIENNLLKAGSSRYQEDPFRKRYPEFSPISRFGIGVLSAFMIADSVTVTTYSPDDPEVHQLTLRSVHGRYLLRLLDKSSDPAAKDLAPHGTEVRLRVRESARLPDVIETLRRWIVIPRCTVRARIEDESDTYLIGYDSPRVALEAALEGAGFDLYSGSGELRDQDVKVVESEQGSVLTAVALKWSQYFREWKFLFRMNPAELAQGFGTCVEGIRVEEATPGFEDRVVPAIVDARGIDAPKTNVARIGLDATRARREMLLRVYGSYFDHVVSEAKALQVERGFSLTWSAREAEMLLEQLVRKRGEYQGRQESVSPLDATALREAMRRQPLVLIEESNNRRLAAADSLGAKDRLWTVDSGLIRAAEEILREIPAEGSMYALTSGFETDALTLPTGVTLVGYDRYKELFRLVLEGREVAAFKVRRDERRVDLGWDLIAPEPRWVPLRAVSDISRERLWESPLYVGRGPLELEGLDGEVAICAHHVWYLLPDSPIAEWARNWIQSIDDRDTRRGLGVVISDLLIWFLRSTKTPEDMQRFIQDRIERSNVRLDENLIDIDSLTEAIDATSLRSFDASAWNRDLEFG